MRPGIGHPPRSAHGPITQVTPTLLDGLLPPNWVRPSSLPFGGQQTAMQA